MDINKKETEPVFAEFEKDPQAPASETPVGAAEEQVAVEEIAATEAPEAEAKPVFFPFPESDYNKKGELKKVRGRMLKKLLKYEFRAIFPALSIGVAILFGLTVLMIILLNVQLNENLAIFTVLSALLYIYALVAIIFVGAGIAISRYNKNFFKEEGYLTFSIPASMEEHTLAKHISGILSTLIGIVASLISLLVLFAFGLDGLLSIFQGMEITIGNPVSFVFEVIEGVIIFAETLAAIFCVAGALTCWGQKFKRKRSIVFRVLIAYIIFMVLESLLLTTLNFAFIDFFYTTAGIHISNCLQILFNAGVIVFSFWYETRYLKKKLNLK